MSPECGSKREAKKPIVQSALEYIRAIDGVDLDISNRVDSVAPQLSMEVNLTGMGVDQ